MRILFRTLIVTSILFFFIFCFVSLTNASPYGGDEYGDCGYGTGCIPTATPTPAPSGNSGSSGSSGSSNTSCTDTPPSSAPNLFQIDRQGDKATLYFAPAGNPYNNYLIIYGFSEADERFGVSYSISNTNGAIVYTINKLSPKAVYYFKVRGGYGCASGAWSKSLWTGSIAGNRKVSFYPQKTSLINRVYTAAKNVQTKITSLKPSLKVAPQTPTKKVTTPAQKQSSTQKSTQNSSQSVKQSLWDRIINFFR